MPTMPIVAIFALLISEVPPPTSSPPAAPASQPSGTAQLSPAVPPFVPPEVAACDECDRITRDWQIEATAFARPLGEFEFKDAPLERVLEELARRAGLPLVADWADLEKNGIARTRPFSFNRNDVAIAVLAEQIERADETRTRFQVRGGELHFATTERLDAHAATCTYDVGWLIDALDAEVGRSGIAGLDGGHGKLALDSQPAETAGGSAGLLFYPQHVYGPETPALRIGRTVVGHVSPDEWHENGGTGRAEVMNRMLIATCSIHAHREIRRLLERMRVSSSCSPCEQLDRDWAMEQAALSRPIEPLNFNDAPLKQVLGRLARAAELPLLVNWKAISPDTPIRLELPSGTVGVALQAALDATPEAAGFEVRDGVLLVDEPDRFTRRNVVCTYEIGWLLDVIEREQHRVYGPLPTTDPQALWQDYANRVDVVQRCIEGCVTADAWNSNGGAATMRPIARTIVVSAPVRTHRELRRLLESLRDEPQKIIGTPKR
ncbi:MAG: hypothetical protein SF069_00595 [Phycisphaerae bacterium]|nr:hypothetical protein [Phycisphaerae bacterium]